MTRDKKKIQLNHGHHQFTVREQTLHHNENNSNMPLSLRLNSISIHFLTSEQDIKDVQNYIFSKPASRGLSEWLVGFKAAL